MPQPDRAWWDNMQYLREPLERKREKEARRGLRLDAPARARAVAERHGGAPVAESELDSIHELDADSIHELDAMPRTPSLRAPRAARRHAADGSLRALPPPNVAAASRAPSHATPPYARPRPPHAAARRHRAGGRSRSPDAPWARPPCPGWSRSTAAARRAVATERVGARPDRLALWAVVLGFFLIFVAVTSTSHAATRAHSAGAASGRVVHQQVVRTHTAALRAIPPAR